MSDFRFYCCTSCGAIFMQNFRDEYCRVCKVAGKVDEVNFYFDTPDHIKVLSAPHEEEDFNG